jgi:hypothetical protein
VKRKDQAELGDGSGDGLNGAFNFVPSELSLRRQIVIDHPTKKPKSMEVCWTAAQDECVVFSL